MFGKQPSVPPFGTIDINDDRDIEVHRPKEAARKHFWQESRLLFRDLIFALMVLALVMVFIIQPVKVEGTSMLPYLHDGERIFVNKLIYYDDFNWAPHIYRGDIVVFWFPKTLRRVTSSASSAAGRHCRGARGTCPRELARDLIETYLDPQLNMSHSSRPPTYVKPGYYFVMGDNRDNSSDSRIWGWCRRNIFTGKRCFVTGRSAPRR
jgi:signal peptidase I